MCGRGGWENPRRKGGQRLAGREEGVGGGDWGMYWFSAAVTKHGLNGSFKFFLTVPEVRDQGTDTLGFS